MQHFVLFIQNLSPFMQITPRALYFDLSHDGKLLFYINDSLE